MFYTICVGLDLSYVRMVCGPNTGVPESWAGWTNISFLGVLAVLGWMDRDPPTSLHIRVESKEIWCLVYLCSQMSCILVHASTPTRGGYRISERQGPANC